MTSLIMIVISTALINNVVLNQFLGICSFLGVSRQIKTSASLGEQSYLLLPFPLRWRAFCMILCWSP